MPFNHGLSAVVDDSAGPAAEMRECPAMTIPKRARSMLVVKQQNESREYDNTMWNE
jgi:hypothetical protein